MTLENAQQKWKGLEILSHNPPSSPFLYGLKNANRPDADLLSTLLQGDFG